jgi:hypothetical protein
MTRRFFFYALLVLGIAAVITAGVSIRQVPAESHGAKILVILQAGTASHEGMARALHAILYTKELKESGYTVSLMFDGAGTEWIGELSNPESTSKLKPLYDEFRVLGISEIVCDYCSGAFEVKKDLLSRNIGLEGAYGGHPSLAEWADQGYQILIL